MGLGDSQILVRNINFLLGVKTTGVGNIFKDTPVGITVLLGI